MPQMRFGFDKQVLAAVDRMLGQHEAKQPSPVYEPQHWPPQEAVTLPDGRSCAYISAGGPVARTRTGKLVETTPTKVRHFDAAGEVYNPDLYWQELAYSKWPATCDRIRKHFEAFWAHCHRWGYACEWRQNSESIALVLPEDKRPTVSFHYTDPDTVTYRLPGDAHATVPIAELSDKRIAELMRLGAVQSRFVYMRDRVTPERWAKTLERHPELLAVWPALQDAAGFEPSIWDTTWLPFTQQLFRAVVDRLLKTGHVAGMGTQAGSTVTLLAGAGPACEPWRFTVGCAGRQRGTIMAMFSQPQPLDHQTHDACDSIEFNWNVLGHWLLRAMGQAFNIPAGPFTMVG